MGRPVLRTALCDLLGIEYPILLAGMGAGSGGSALAELVAAVSEAGGLGVLGAAGLGPEQIHEQCAKIRLLTSKPFGVDILLPGNTAEAPAPTANGGDNSPRSPLDMLPSQYKDWTDSAIEHFQLQQPPPRRRPPAAGRG